MVQNKKNQKAILPFAEEENPSVCALCRGTKFLCGKSQCPIIVKYHSRNKVKPLINKLKIEGASPPSVFIGRVGYPKVSIGPMIPPVMGDTSIIDTPELWLDKSIDDIVDFRSQLVRGTHLVNIHDVESSDRIVEFTKELALSKNSVFAEALFSKRPHGNIAFYDEAQPHGPSAPLKKFDISNPKYEQHVEKAYYDTDLKSKDAVFKLYKEGVRISQIQKAFSVGAFGIKKYRKFVPTRWSITAVDSNIGETLMKNTKTYPWINEFRIYYHNQFDNRWAILMMPSEWQYELIEAWYPNTTWNPYGRGISMFNSYEFYKGRKTYAEIGGCYYSARLATNELLNKERRQAGIVIMREAHPGYIMPIGVWNVRESVRRALKGSYQKFDTLDKALVFISKKMDIPLQRWIKNSAVLKNKLYQKRLEDF
ncbi:MAG: Nre family DNA repair protein [Candidatus Thermoplasmatota archaeon]|nr:Nre family DNA repair protein [Candidatus Thermoplasmatota archaeon]